MDGGDRLPILQDAPMERIAILFKEDEIEMDTTKRMLPVKSTMPLAPEWKVKPSSLLLITNHRFCLRQTVYLSFRFKPPLVAEKVLPSPQAL